MVQNHKLQKSNTNDDLANRSLYRKLVRKLLYLTFSQPDISYSAHVLSQFMDRPLVLHMKATHRVLRFLKGSPGKGLFFPANNTLKLQVYSDSFWGSCLDTRRSISGY